MKERILGKIAEERKTLNTLLMNARNKANAYCASFISKDITLWTEEEIRMHQAASKALKTVEGKITSRLIDLDSAEGRIRSLEAECAIAAQELNDANAIPAKNPSKSSFVRIAQDKLDLANTNFKKYLNNVETSLDKTKLTDTDLTLHITGFRRVETAKQVSSAKSISKKALFGVALGAALAATLATVGTIHIVEHADEIPVPQIVWTKPEDNKPTPKPTPDAKETLEAWCRTEATNYMNRLRANESKDHKLSLTYSEVLEMIKTANGVFSEFTVADQAYVNFCAYYAEVQNLLAYAALDNGVVIPVNTCDIFYNNYQAKQQVKSFEDACIAIMNSGYDKEKITESSEAIDSYITDGASIITLGGKELKLEEYNKAATNGKGINPASNHIVLANATVMASFDQYYGNAKRGKALFKELTYVKTDANGDCIFDANDPMYPVKDSTDFTTWIKNIKETLKAEKEAEKGKTASAGHVDSNVRRAPARVLRREMSIYSKNAINNQAGCRR